MHGPAPMSRKPSVRVAAISCWLIFFHPSWVLLPVSSWHFPISLHICLCHNFPILLCFLPVSFWASHLCPLRLGFLMRDELLSLIYYGIITLFFIKRLWWLHEWVLRKCSEFCLVCSRCFTCELLSLSLLLLLPHYYYYYYCFGFLYLVSVFPLSTHSCLSE